MDNEFETKEYIMPKEYTINDDNVFEEITEEEYSEDLTSFEQDVIPKEEDPLNLIEERKEKRSQKKEKKSFKEKWQNCNKKKKIIIIVSSIVLLAVIIVLVIYFLGKKDNTPEKKEEPNVVIQKDNYRYENGKLILLDENDTKIGSYECKNKNENKCRIAYQNNEDNFDEERFVYEDGTKIKFTTPIILNKYAFIYDNRDENNGMIFQYDMSENKIIENYKSVKYYAFIEDEYLILENDESKYGLFKIEENGLTKLIDFKYDYLGIKQEEFKEYKELVAKKDDKYLIVDIKGAEVSKKISNEIKSFNKKYIAVVDESGLYNVKDYRNNTIFKNEYNFLILKDNFVVGVSDKTKIKVLDYNEILLQNKDITVPNEYYNKTFVYDKNDNYLETHESFWVLNNDSSVSIEYYKNDSDVESKVVNIYEGIVSNEYDYVSYFDGILYIYEEQEKTNLVGQYKCTNSNNISSVNATYDNCYLAKESSLSDNELNSKNNSLGYLPLINKRFIFINDSIDESKNNIVLYDLKKKESLGVYLEIDAGIYSGAKSLDFITNNNLKVIAKSANKRAYGVITITKDSVSQLLSAKYDYIERISSYFEVKNPGDTYQLFDESGEELTNEVSSKIVNFTNNYIKTKNNNLYSIYSFNREQYIENKEYIELKNGYFVVIENNIVNIFEYSNFKEAYGTYKLENLEGKYTYVSSNNKDSIKVRNESGLEITVDVNKGSIYGEE